MKGYLKGPSNDQMSVFGDCMVPQLRVPYGLLFKVVIKVLVRVAIRVTRKGPC